MLDFVFLALSVGPILIVVLLDSVLYDGWRQIYFVYPALVLTAMRGLVFAYGLARHIPLGSAGLTTGLLVTVASLGF